MDLEQTALRGYVFVPYCTEECCQSQLQGFQALPSSYPTSASKYNPFLPEQMSSSSLAAHSSRFTSLKTGAYRVLFPAISRERTQPSEVSRHKVGVKSLLSAFQPVKGISFRSVFHIYRLDIVSHQQQLIFTPSSTEGVVCHLQEMFHCCSTIFIWRGGGRGGGVFNS